MAIPSWQPSTIYAPGAIVIPTTVPGAAATVIPNADFESGDTDWTKGTGWAINANLAFAGSISAEYSGPGVAKIVSSTKHPVAPGKAITAICFVHQGASADGEASAAVILEWYDAVDALISTSTGNTVNTGAVGVWRKSSVSATAPPNAAKVSIGATSNNNWAPLNVDNFSWNYVTGAAATGLAFKSVGPSTGVRTDVAFVDSNPDTITRVAGSFVADGFKPGNVLTIAGSASNNGIQSAESVDALTITLPLAATLVAEGAGASITITAPAEAGTSGASEPIWPSGAGTRVADNDIIWEAVQVDSVTWEASSILTSGSSEPAFPTEPGAFVADGNIAWEAVPLRITDEKCPHTKVVAIAASKVFAGDRDVVRFSATLNARDWSTPDDAGFLPTGLQQKAQVGVDAMGVYRGNLAVWSPSNFQVWQVDPDPAAMALLDAMEGTGSEHQQAVQPITDDLFFLSKLGVRTVSTAAGGNNLASGDAGVPIDVLVQAEVNAGDVEPIATYYPSGGQYWLAFRPLSFAAALLAGQFLLTSPIYPIEALDELNFSARPTGGGTFGVVTEKLQFSATPIDSELTKILFATGVPNEDLQFSATPLDGLLETVGLETGVPNEDLQFSATPLNSELEGALVQHTNPAETLDWTAKVTGGGTT